jgi:hypothetical protein
MEDNDSTLHVHRAHHEMLPVWFFIGCLLLFYGLVILFVGIREFHHPPAVVLAGYHASLWGGIFLTVFGGGFTIHFAPRRKRRGNEGASAGPKR